MSKKKDDGEWTITYTLSEAEHKQYIAEMKYIDAWLEFLNKEEKDESIND